MKNQRKKVARLSCCSAIFGSGAPAVSSSAISGREDQPDHGDDAERRPGRCPRIPEASRSASAWSPASRWSTKVGTRTAESAPAASSSNRTFETELERLVRVARGRWSRGPSRSSRRGRTRRCGTAAWPHPCGWPRGSPRHWMSRPRAEPLPSAKVGERAVQESRDAVAGRVSVGHGRVVDAVRGRGAGVGLVGLGAGRPCAGLG